MRFGARAVQHQTTGNETVTVEFIKSDNPLKDCEDKVYSPKKSIMEIYSTICYCREPCSMLERSSGEHLQQCAGPCGTTFHKTCLPIDDQGKRGWICAADTLPISGIKWSAGKQTNTCTIDNFLTAAALESLKNPEFQRAMAKFPYTYPGQQIPRGGDIGTGLNQVLNAVKREEYAKAHNIYANVLKHKYPELADTLETDLHGTEQQMVYDVLQMEESSFKDANVQGVLTKRSRIRPNIQFTTASFLPLIKHELEYGNTESKKCPNCPDSIVTNMGLKVPDETHPPSFSTWKWTHLPIG